MTDSKEWEVSSAQLMKTHGYSTPSDQRKVAENARRAEDLARDIMKLSRDTLLINLRFLEAAFVQFVHGDSSTTREIATDGRYLYYDPFYICRKFREGREVPARDYLHVVFHCLFRQLFAAGKKDMDLWYLSCDIAVEDTITGLGLKCLNCARQEKQRWLIEKLHKDIDHITAERVFVWFKNEKLPPEEYIRLRADFYADDHSLWYSDGGAGKDSGENDRDMTKAADGTQDKDAVSAKDSGQSAEEQPGEDTAGSDAVAVPGGDDNDSSRGRDSSEGSDDERKKDPALTPEETEQIWKDISQRIEVDLDTFSRTWGDGAGGMQQSLKEVNRERYDYGTFLKRFASLGENMEINDDEFDYIFYTYGMQLYEKMPLVEPLEYKEVKKVREFVIALDTSESVAGDLVQKFVSKTWNILKQTENFFTKINIHILQCGARVEEDAKITSQDDFDAYIDSMVLRGFGGTDFRPVFERVNKLIREHEFGNFKGLIYFTDGCGTFPAAAPEFETAFVFLDQGHDIPEVPAWAMRLILEQEEIEDEGSGTRSF